MTQTSCFAARFQRGTRPKIGGSRTGLNRRKKRTQIDGVVESLHQNHGFLLAVQRLPQDLRARRVDQQRRLSCNTE